MPNKLRTLCLHSFRTSAAFLELQLGSFSNVGRLLSEHCEFVYLSAPNRAAQAVEESMPESMRRLSPPPYYEWWNARDEADGTVVYDHLDASLQHVSDFIRREGPFDGVLGFSQGGSLAHLLCMLDREDGGLPQERPLRFSIILSARVTRHAAHAPLLQAAASRPLTLPSLVLYGGRDNDVPAEMTRELVATFEPEAVTAIFLPDGGHRVPKLAEADAASAVAFVQAVRDSDVPGSASRL